VASTAGRISAIHHYASPDQNSPQRGSDTRGDEPSPRSATLSTPTTVEMRPERVASRLVATEYHHISFIPVFLICFSSLLRTPTK
jgi:hypothetical protein